MHMADPDAGVNVKRCLPSGSGCVSVTMAMTKCERNIFALAGGEGRRAESVAPRMIRPVQIPVTTRERPLVASRWAFRVLESKAVRESETSANPSTFGAEISNPISDEEQSARYWLIIF